MNLELSGKNCLIAGGTSGIGLAACESLLAEGCNIATFSRNTKKVERAHKQLSKQKLSTKLLVEQCDYTDFNSAKLLIKKVHNELGKIDVLVCSSGGPSPSSAQSMDFEVAQAALHQNFLSIQHLINQVLPQMVAQKWGRILVISTSGIIQPIQDLAPSNMSRAALAAYAKNLSNEIAKDNITVNTIVPGSIYTDRLKQIIEFQANKHGRSELEQTQLDHAKIPAGQYGKPEDIGNLVAYLASEKANYITGSVIRVDGGSVISI